MEKVVLRSELMPAFRYAVHMIELATEGRMKASDLRLGGGTALATLWQHRLSTDLDFVANRDVFRQSYGSEARVRMRDVLRRERDAGKAPVTGITATFNMFGFRHDGVPVSIVGSSLGDIADVFSNYVIENSGVRLAKPEAVIQGKTVGRLLKRNNPTDRDGYDIGVALTHYPSVFQGSIAELDTSERAALVEAVRNASGVTGRGRAIVNPSYPDLAADPWGSVARALERILGDSGSTLPHASSGV